ncbi:MAG TPA: sigma-70 family RNA polymerase sigma factor [Rugosimonospora sp.]|nr:sigma-70 family RNA polymerase sigma factor [Rugosimonospora sp.]
MAHDDAAGLLRSAAAGDQGAWDAIVARYAALVWTVARGFRLSAADAADVSQATWLRLVERLDQVRDPEALGAWLATTARREALNLLRKRRDLPVAEVDVNTDGGAEDEQAAPWRRLVTADRDNELWQAFTRLPARCQEILRLLVIDPAESYAAAAAALAVPIGSLGPTRSRCLASLRELLRSYATEG